MKKIAKFISGLLSAALAFNFAAPAVSEAMAAADDTIQSMSEVVRAGLENFETNIDISRFELDPNSGDDLARVSEVISYVIKMPDLFYVDIDLQKINVSCKLVEETNTFVIGELRVVYNNTPEDAAPLKDELSAKIDEIVDKVITDDMTELQKALTLHDYIVLNTVYDTTGALDDLNNGASAYDILICGNGVCEGYAQAYNMLLEKCGISSVMVTSYDMCHAWNLVNIDNEWYHVDTTWDDPVPDYKGRVNHKYFMLSDEEIMKETDSRKAHHDWDSKGFEATSKKYDDAFWSTVSTEINIRGDKWYFVDNEGEYSQYMESTGEVNHFVSICDEKWPVWNDSLAFWSGKYVSIIVSGEKVLFNTPEMIYIMNLDGSEKGSFKYINPWETNGYVYGMVIDNGKLYAVIKQKPSEEGKLFEVCSLDELDIKIEDNSVVVDTFLDSVKALQDGAKEVYDWKNRESEDMVLPAEAIECIRGRDVKITLNLDGYSWDIRGKNVTAEEAQDLNLEIKENQGIIPEEMIQSVTDSNMFVELNLTHHGQFGLKANIKYEIGSEYANQPAILYYYNQAESTMDQIDFMLIDGDGNLNIDLYHASSYGVVLPNVQSPSDPIISEQEKPPEVTPAVTETEEPAVTTTAVSEEPVVTTTTTIAPPQEITTPAETTISSTVKVDPEVLKGDVNTNGIVDISDLSFLSLACLGEVELTDVQMLSADVTHDGEVGLADLACIKQFLMNVITEF